MSRYEVSCNGLGSRVAGFEREMTLSQCKVLVFDGDLYTVKVQGVPKVRSSTL